MRKNEKAQFFKEFKIKDLIHQIISNKYLLGINIVHINNRSI